MKIWKQVFQPNSKHNDVYTIDITARKGAKAISVALQAGQCCVWYEVDPNAPMEVLKLYCVGTGFGVVPDDKRFLGTIVQGDYVWHIYCEK